MTGVANKIGTEGTSNESVGLCRPDSSVCRGDSGSRSSSPEPLNRFDVSTCWNTGPISGKLNPASLEDFECAESDQLVSPQVLVHTGPAKEVVKNHTDDLDIESRSKDPETAVIPKEQERRPDGVGSESSGTDTTAEIPIAESKPHSDVAATNGNLPKNFLEQLEETRQKLNSVAEVVRGEKGGRVQANEESDPGEFREVYLIPKLSAVDEDDTLTQDAAKVQSGRHIDQDEQNRHKEKALVGQSETTENKLECTRGRLVASKERLLNMNMIGRQPPGRVNSEHELGDIDHAENLPSRKYVAQRSTQRGPFDLRNLSSNTLPGACTHNSWSKNETVMSRAEQHDECTDDICKTSSCFPMRIQSDHLGGGQTEVAVGFQSHHAKVSEMEYDLDEFIAKRLQHDQLSMAERVNIPAESEAIGKSQTGVPSNSECWPPFESHDSEGSQILDFPSTIVNSPKVHVGDSNSCDPASQCSDIDIGLDLVHNKISDVAALYLGAADQVCARKITPKEAMDVQMLHLEQDGGLQKLFPLGNCCKGSEACAQQVPWISSETPAECEYQNLHVTEYSSMMGKNDLEQPRQHSCGQLYSSMMGKNDLEQHRQHSWGQLQLPYVNSEQKLEAADLSGCAISDPRPSMVHDSGFQDCEVSVEPSDHFHKIRITMEKSSILNHSDGAFNDTIAPYDAGDMAGIQHAAGQGLAFFPETSKPMIRIMPTSRIGTTCNGDQIQRRLSNQTPRFTAHPGSHFLDDPVQTRSQLQQNTQNDSAERSSFWMNLSSSGPSGSNKAPASPSLFPGSVSDIFNCMCESPKSPCCSVKAERGHRQALDPMADFRDRGSTCESRTFNAMTSLHCSTKTTTSDGDSHNFSEVVMNYWVN